MRYRDQALVWLCSCLILMPTFALANGEATTTEYSTNALIRMVIAVVGGLIALLGILLAFKNAMAVSDVGVSSSREKGVNVRLKKVSQGVIITLLGVVVLVAGLYLLPDKTMVHTIKGKVIETTPSGDTALD